MFYRVHWQFPQISKKICALWIHWYVARYHYPVTLNDTVYVGLTPQEIRFQLFKYAFPFWRMYEYISGTVAVEILADGAGVPTIEYGKIADAVQRSEMALVTTRA